MSILVSALRRRRFLTCSSESDGAFWNGRRRIRKTLIAFWRTSSRRSLLRRQMARTHQRTCWMQRTRLARSVRGAVHQVRVVLVDLSATCRISHSQISSRGTNGPRRFYFKTIVTTESGFWRRRCSLSIWKLMLSSANSPFERTDCVI